MLTASDDKTIKVGDSIYVFYSYSNFFLFYHIISDEFE